MTKSELESKPLADLHQLAAAAGVERYRMLSRAELIERLGDGEGDGGGGAPRGAAGAAGRERPRRRRRRTATSGPEREARADVEDEEERPPAAAPSEPTPPAASRRRDEEPEGGAQPRRRRRRRRFGRRREEGVSIQGLLLPPESGRQALLVAADRGAATELLRGVAADLSAASHGPDPVALLIDPSPEELADWKREAPRAELVSAGQAHHASDAVAQARRRAAGGEDVILLVDSLTRFAASFGDAEGAKELFDAGRAEAASGKGSLTVVAVLERP